MRALRICAIGLLIAAAAASRAAADEVTEWNEILFRVAAIAGSSPLNMSRFSALVQASVFDAVNGIDPRYKSIHVDPAAPAGASRRAAAVQAAFAILSKLYGTGGLFTPNQQQSLDAKRTASLADIAADESAASITAGVAWGQTVADAIWTWRSTDGFSLAAPTWVGSTAIGQWRPTPTDPYPGAPGKGVGLPQFVTMVPWAIESPSQFRPAGPPALTSTQYARDFNETKTLGSLNSAGRTADQTVYAWFWQISTASYLWNRAALNLIEKRHQDNDDRQPWSSHHHRLLENARILAELDVAMADAAIGCWDAKYFYNFWRPITAIRDSGDDGNAMTSSDATWTPLFTTPAHPDYPSGHSCVSGAAAAILANEFGEHAHFTMSNDIMLGVTRSFRSFAEALEEMKNARIVAGIHFRTATEDGVGIGTSVAEHVLTHKFQRIK